MAQPVIKQIIARPLDDGGSDLYGLDQFGSLWLLHNWGWGLVDHAEKFSTAGLDKWAERHGEDLDE